MNVFENIAQNAFVDAVNQRLSTEKLSDKNKEKTEQFRDYCRQDAVVALLVASNAHADMITMKVNARHTFAVYNLFVAEQIIQFAANAKAFFRDTTMQTFRTLVALDNDDKLLTLNDANACCTTINDKSVKIDAEREKYIHRHASIVENTSRQTTMNVQAMLFLNMITQVSKDAFKLNRDNAIVKLVRERMKLAERVEIET